MGWTREELDQKIRGYVKMPDFTPEEKKTFCQNLINSGKAKTFGDISVDQLLELW